MQVQFPCASQLLDHFGSVRFYLTEPQMLEFLPHNYIQVCEVLNPSLNWQNLASFQFSCCYSKPQLVQQNEQKNVVFCRFILAYIRTHIKCAWRRAFNYYYAVTRLSVQLYSRERELVLFGPLYNTKQITKSLIGVTKSTQKIDFWGFH